MISCIVFSSWSKAEGGQTGSGVTLPIWKLEQTCDRNGPLFLDLDILYKRFANNKGIDQPCSIL